MTYNEEFLVTITNAGDALRALATEARIRNQLTERALALQERAVKVQEELAADSKAMRQELHRMDMGEVQ